MFLWLLQMGFLTGLATSAVALGEVAALDHKVLDDTVEGRSLVAEALLAGGESAEVLSSLRDSLAIETKGDTAEVLIAVLNVEVDLVSDLGALGGSGSLGEEDQTDCQEQHGRGQKAAEVEHVGGCIDNDAKWGKRKTIGEMNRLELGRRARGGRTPVPWIPRSALPTPLTLAGSFPATNATELFHCLFQAPHPSVQAAVLGKPPDNFRPGIIRPVYEFHAIQRQEEKGSQTAHFANSQPPWYVMTSC